MSLLSNPAAFRKKFLASRCERLRINADWLINFAVVCLDCACNASTTRLAAANIVSARWLLSSKDHAL
jgi:hypothetical protein